MKIEKFINGFKMLANENMKDKYVKDSLKYKKYLPFNEKVVICDKIVKCTSYENVYDENNNIIDQKIKIDSRARVLFHILSLIKYYTNLEFDMANAAEVFDSLNELKLTEKILDNISEDERSEFQTLLDMTTNDFIQNNMSFESIVTAQVERFSRLCGAALSPVFSGLKDLEPQQIEQAAKIINIFSKKK